MPLISKHTVCFKFIFPLWCYMPDVRYESVKCLWVILSHHNWSYYPLLCFPNNLLLKLSLKLIMKSNLLNCHSTSIMTVHVPLADRHMQTTWHWATHLPPPLFATPQRIHDTPMGDDGSLVNYKVHYWKVQWKCKVRSIKPKTDKIPLNIKKIFIKLSIFSLTKWIPFESKPPITVGVPWGYFAKCCPTQWKVSLQM